MVVICKSRVEVKILNQERSENWEHCVMEGPVMQWNLTEGWQDLELWGEYEVAALHMPSTIPQKELCSSCFLSCWVVWLTSFRSLLKCHLLREAFLTIYHSLFSCPDLWFCLGLLTLWHCIVYLFVYFRSPPVEKPMRSGTLWVLFMNVHLAPNVLLGIQEALV